MMRPTDPRNGDHEIEFMTANYADLQMTQNSIAAAGTADEIFELNEARLQMLSDQVAAIVEDIHAQMPISEQNAQLRALRAVVISLEMIRLEVRQLRAVSGK